MAYTQEKRERTLMLLEENTIYKVSEITGIPQPTIRSWKTRVPKVKIEPQTLSYRVNRIKRYLLKKYKTLRLTTKQAFDEMGLSRGSELGELLNTPKLNSLGVSDIARYIVLYT